MQGYNFPKKPIDLTPVETSITVSCRRCNNYWSETVMMAKDLPRINGPSRYYDYCDKCADTVAFGVNFNELKSPNQPNDEDKT